MLETLKEAALKLAAQKMLAPYGLELKHYVPGRLRVVVHNWQTREQELRRLIGEMENDPDVRVVTFTEATGSLLIEFNKDAAFSQEILNRWKGIISKYM